MGGSEDFVYISLSLLSGRFIDGVFGKLVSLF